MGARTDTRHHHIEANAQHRVNAGLPRTGWTRSAGVTMQRYLEWSR